MDKRYGQIVTRQKHVHFQKKSTEKLVFKI